MNGRNSLIAVDVLAVGRNPAGKDRMLTAVAAELLNVDQHYRAIVTPAAGRPMPVGAANKAPCLMANAATKDLPVFPNQRYVNGAATMWYWLSYYHFCY